MKSKILLSALLTFAATGVLVAAQVEETAAADTPVVVRDTVYKNATQYSLDSLRYASEFNLQTTLENLRNERYRDSVVYSQMSAEQLYRIQMTRQSRYWQSDYQRFMNGPFPALLIAVCLMLAFAMVLKARERGKQRAQELKMAQLEAAQKARIVFRERRAAESDPRLPEQAEEEYEMDLPFDRPDYGALFQRTKRNVASYVRSPRRYRKTGILILIFSVGAMLFFGLVGNGDAWVLGIIPLFISFAYLYLDYASQKTEQQRREVEEFRRYKAEKEAAGQNKGEQGESSVSEPRTEENTPA